MIIAKLLYLFYSYLNEIRPYFNQKNSDFFTIIRYIFKHLQVFFDCLGDYFQNIAVTIKYYHPN